MKYYAWYVNNEILGGLYCSDGSYFPPGYSEITKDKYLSAGGIIPEKTPIELEQEHSAELEDVLCALDTSYSERLASVEDALCELDKEEIV